MLTFKYTFLFLGGFHTIKVIEGKDLDGSGADDIFSESGVFGTNTAVDQVLTGSHYVRSMKGYTYLYEALFRLQLQPFFTEEKKNQYLDQIVSLIFLKESISENNESEAKIAIKSFVDNCSEMMTDFYTFVEHQCQVSNLFKYWNNILVLISLMLDLVRADRMGDIRLHNSLIKAMPLFLAFDRVNYARWMPVYVSDLFSLEKNSPDDFAELLKGRFTVKQTNVPFTSVCTD